MSQNIIMVLLVRWALIPMVMLLVDYKHWNLEQWRQLSGCHFVPKLILSHFNMSSLVKSDLPNDQNVWLADMSNNHNWSDTKSLSPTTTKSDFFFFPKRVAYSINFWLKTYSTENKKVVYVL